MKLTQTIRDIKRLNQIINVLFGQELGYLIEQLGLKSHLTYQKRLQKDKFKRPSSLPLRLRKSMEELSGTFVKLGQFLSLRPDLIPKEYCNEFSKLQDNVTSFQFNEVKRIIEDEFKSPLEDIFLSFDHNPIASASIGQVHKAKLKDNRIVAIKVQRPNIERIFETDIDILYHLAHLVEKYIPKTRAFNPTSIIHEFEKYTKQELDYNTEADNISKFHENFKNDKIIVIPRVYPKYTTRKVLTMNYIDGEKITNVKKLDKKHIINSMSEAFIKQVLEYGFFHADPHPGNIFILPNQKIALLDFGIVGRVSENMKDDVENAFIALIKPDRELLAKSFINLGFVEENTILEEFEKDLSAHLKKYYDKPLEDISIAVFFHDIIDLAKIYSIRFPADFILLIKAMTTVEGFIKEIDPKFNFVTACKPSFKKIIKKRSTPKYILTSIKDNIIDLHNNIREAINTIKKGKVKVDVEDVDIKRFALEIDRSSNRITFGIIIAALIVGSSLIMRAGLPPYLFGIPGFGLLLMAVAAILAITLAISIHNEKGGSKWTEKE